MKQAELQMWSLKNESIKVCAGIGKKRDQGQYLAVTIPDDVNTLKRSEISSFKFISVFLAKLKP